MAGELPSPTYWESVWDGVALPRTASPSWDLRVQFERYLPQSDTATFLEVGCAPGGYMAYFHKAFGYRVSGVDYAHDAVRLTRQNLEIQGIPGEVLEADFFAYRDPHRYDVVFSAGFIEHFDDTPAAVARLCDLCTGWVVTLVPNLEGVNGLISRTLRPQVYARHRIVTLDHLRAAHETSGFRTRFCDYVGGLRFIMPAEKHVFWTRHGRLARVANLPFKVFNKLCGKCSEWTTWVPRTRALSETLLYIGQRPDDGNADPRRQNER